MSDTQNSMDTLRYLSRKPTRAVLEFDDNGKYALNIYADNHFLLGVATGFSRRPSDVFDTMFALKREYGVIASVSYAESFATKMANHAS